jgi:hypothetical protein
MRRLMKNKIDHANRILCIMDRYPNMMVKELLYLIECRIEGEKFVIFTASPIFPEWKKG